MLTSESGLRTTASLIHVYEPEPDGHETPAPTVRNMARALFAQEPAATRAAIVLTERGALLMLFEVNHSRWFDVTGAPVKVERIP